MKPLDRYDEKRDPERTREPFGVARDGAAETTRGHFVIHLHNARRRHFDLRLQSSGVLLSFALPKGPTLDPDARHLAVRTEDHPLEYLDFEDVIASGQYGAGAMIAWDRGTVRYLEMNVERGVAAGKIDFVLSGFKVAGRYALVKLKKGKDEWLLLKKRDGYEDAANDVTSSKPRSVYSGLVVEERADAARWLADWRERAATLSHDHPPPREESGPLAELVVTDAEHPLPTGFVWAPTYGGLRVRITKEGSAIRIDAKSDDIADRFPEVVAALRAHAATDLLLEGELVVRDDDGRARANLLQERLRTGSTTYLATFVAHDILRLATADVRGAPLAARGALLQSVVAATGVVSAAPLFDVDGRSFAERAARLGFYGVVGALPKAAHAATVWHFLPAALDESRPLDPLAPSPPQPSSPRVATSNGSKVYFPEAGLTKADVVAYYEAVAPLLLPYLAHRPLALVRYPDGIHGKSFFQWHLPLRAPSWVRTLEVLDDSGGSRRAFLLDDVDGLRYVANLGALPLHILAFREGRSERPDFFTLDFDVKQSSLRAAVPIVRDLEALVRQCGLVPLLKTSGQTGLHVLVPLGDDATFDVARGLADLFGTVLVTLHPERATMERRVEKRGTKVFIDTGQTGPTRTIVAPYALRATPSASVSTPLRWDELDPGLDPGSFNLRTVPTRLATRADPMRELLSAKADVQSALAAVATMLRERSLVR